MIITVNPEISSGESIEIPFPRESDVMDGKKDFTCLVKAAGGETGASADVTLSLSVWADIDPAQEDVDGVTVDTSSWVNVTRGIYRPDRNEMVDADSVDFVGATPSVAWLDLDDLNADKVKFVIEFSDTPDGEPASLIIKNRRDAL
jgi:hypothetical protein